MWQRKQSLFLFLAAALSFATWAFPVATYEQAGATYEFRTTGLYGAEDMELADVGMKIPFSIILSVLGAALIC